MHHDRQITMLCFLLLLTFLALFNGCLTDWSKDTISGIGVKTFISNIDYENYQDNGFQTDNKTIGTGEKTLVANIDHETHQDNGFRTDNKTVELGAARTAMDITQTPNKNYAQIMINSTEIADNKTEIPYFDVKNVQFAVYPVNAVDYDEDTVVFILVMIWAAVLVVLWLVKALSFI